MGRRQTALAACLTLAVVLLAYLRPLFLGDTLALRDHTTITMPSRAHLGQSLATGDLPEWWSGVGLGVPFAANPMHGVTYPPTWLAAALPMPWAIDFLIVLHVLLLAAGVLVLCRRLGASAPAAMVAACAVALSGYAASMAVNGVPLMTMAWTPWVLWACERLITAVDRKKRNAFLALAALCAVQLCSGDPAGMITSFLLCLGWTTCRSKTRSRHLALVAASWCAAAVLAAVALLPALYTMLESSRAGGIDAQTAQGWSMHPLRLLEFFWPNALGDASDSQLNLARSVANTAPESQMGTGWSLSLYLGAPVLMLAAYAKPRRLWWVVLAFTVLALGSFTPLYDAYRWLFLPERAIRYPERHIFAAILLVGVLASQGMTRISEAERRPWRAFAAVAAIIGCARIAVAIGRGSGVAFANESGLDGEAAWSIVESGGTVAFLSCLGLCAMTLAAKRSVQVASGVIATIVIVGSLSHSWATHKLVDRGEFERPPDLLSSIDAKSNPRIYRHRSLVPRGDYKAPGELISALYHAGVANGATRFGFSYAPGYDPAIPQRVKDVWEQGAKHGLQVVALYGVDWLVVRPGQVPRHVKPVSATTAGDLLIVPAPRARPRAFVSYAWTYTDSFSSSELFGSGFDPARIVLEGVGEDSVAKRAVSPCTVHRPSSDEIELSCNADAPGYAVLLEAFHPGWKAWVNGRTTRIEQADGFVRAVPIEVGTHQITMQFETPGLRLGAFFSFLGWLALLILALWPGLRTRFSRARETSIST